ncbi:phage minor head protein [Marinobacter alexandrii]|uniref:phage minor head protein n=1 Tax=Marinobacter alexandrii TaxID=2570351 RepID=UPI001107E792|nr:phage minor head protein [Marinobacter alexandrii]
MDDFNLSDIAEGQERAFSEAFSEAISNIKEGARIKEIIERIDAGDVEGVLLALGLSEASFGLVEGEIQSAYRKGGHTGAKQVGRIPGQDGAITFVLSFNVGHPRAEQWLRENSSRLITEVTTDQKTMVRERLSAGVSAGRNPRQSALDLVGRVNRVTGRREGGFIGMTSRQAEWTANARAEIESLDESYLDRQLRDRRFDRLFRRSVRTGEPIKKEQIDRMIVALQRRTLKYRGDTIARNESINALRAGQHEALVQALEAGSVPESDISRAWDATGDSRTRQTHMQAEGQRVVGNQPFMVGGYPMRYPGDSSMGAPARETLLCRCIERTEIDFGARVARIEGFG